MRYTEKEIIKLIEGDNKVLDKLNAIGLTKLNRYQIKYLIEILDRKKDDYARERKKEYMDSGVKI